MRVKSLEQQLLQARTPVKLDGLWSARGWARLFEDRVETSKGTMPLSPSVVADVSSTGSVAAGGRSTLTRMGTGAIVAGPLGYMVGMIAKKDLRPGVRELYLILKDDAGGIVLPCNPDQGEKVRRFALNLLAAARGARMAAQSRQQLVAEAERALRTTQEDMATFKTA